jgi:hypothetical protein
MFYATNTFAISPPDSFCYGQELAYAGFIKDGVEWIRKFDDSPFKTCYFVTFALGMECFHWHYATQGRHDTIVLQEVDGEQQFVRLPGASSMVSEGKHENDEELGCPVDISPLIQLMWNSGPHRDITFVQPQPQPQESFSGAFHWNEASVNAIVQALATNYPDLQKQQDFIAGVYVGLEGKGGYILYKHHGPERLAESERAFTAVIGQNGIATLTWLPNYRRKQLLKSRVPDRLPLWLNPRPAPVQQQATPPKPKSFLDLSYTLRHRIYKAVIGGDDGVYVDLDKQTNFGNTMALLRTSKDFAYELKVPLWTTYKFTLVMNASTLHTSFGGFQHLRKFLTYNSRKKRCIKRINPLLKVSVDKPATLGDIRIGMLDFLEVMSEQREMVVRIALEQTPSSDPAVGASSPRVVTKTLFLSQIRASATKFLRSHWLSTLRKNNLCPQILMDGHGTFVGFHRRNTVSMSEELRPTPNYLMSQVPGFLVVGGSKLRQTTSECMYIDEKGFWR